MKNGEYVLCAVLTKYLQCHIFQAVFSDNITYSITMIIYQHLNHVTLSDP